MKHNSTSTTLTSAQWLASLSLAIAIGAASSSAIAHDAAQTSSTQKREKATKAQAMPKSNLKGTAKTSKTGMGVFLDYSFASATVDRAGLLSLTITRRGGGDDATITIQTDEALRLAQGLPSDNAAFNPGASYTLKVQPLTDGLSYLNVFLKSANRSESLAIPVQLGKETKLQKTGAVQNMPSGERIKSVPAQ